MQESAFIIWSDRFRLGHDEIDRQHQQIIAVINELFSAISANAAASEVESILGELVDYTEQHFAREEELMRERGFPNLAKHKRLHDELARRTRELNSAAMHNKSETANEALEFLKEWWIDHILLKDWQYRPYMVGSPQQATS